MEHLKYGAEDIAWQEKLVNKFREEFPEANFRDDEEYFIYDVPGGDGKMAEVHTPKWEKMPLWENGRQIGRPATEKLMRLEIKARFAHPGKPFSLIEAAREEGLFKSSEDIVG
ncbi:MAG: hypothetical protein AAB867_02210 [Patescibacteria group bacterium]